MSGEQRLCPECGKWPLVRADGTLTPHDYPPIYAPEKTGRCPASGPAPEDAQIQLDLTGGAA